MPHLGVVVSTAMSAIRRRGDSDKGATMIEYALLLTFIAMVVILALFAFGPFVAGLYTRFPPGL